MANKKQRAKDLVLDTYRDSKEFFEPIRNKFYDLYQLSIGKPLKRKKKFNRFVPYIPAAIDLVLPRLAGRLPIFEVNGRSEDDHQHATIMNNVVEYFVNKTNFHQFEMDAIKQAMVYGTCITQNGWDLQKQPLHPDLVKDDKETSRIVKDEPLHTIIPIENVFPHRKKVRIQDEWGIVIREEVSRRDLKRDPNIDNAALGQVGPSTSEEEWFDQRNQNAQVHGNDENATGDEDNDILVKLTYWGPFDGEEYVITVVNGSTVVRFERNPFWHQLKPFSKLDFTPNPHSFFCDGLVAQLWDLQLELNEIRNVRSAARAIALKIPLLIDRNANVNLSEIRWEHSAKWLADFKNNPNPIRPMEIPSKLLELDREEERVVADMQLRSGVNDVVIGGNEIGVQGGDTATGASIAAEQTSLRFKTQTIQIDQWIKDIGEQDISNIQQFVDRELVFAISGKEGLEWRTYTPDMMRQFRFDFAVQPSSTFVEPRAAKREKLLQLKQLYDEDPTIDQDKLDRMILDAFDMQSDQLKKPSDEIMRDQKALELEELAMQISSPEFDQLPPEEQELLLVQMEQLRAEIGQEPGQQTTAPMPQMQPVGSVAPPELAEVPV